MNTFRIKIQRLVVTLSMLLFLVTIFSCSAKDNPTASHEENNFVFPLKIGNKWEYRREFSTFNFRPDTGEEAPSDTTISSVSTVECIECLNAGAVQKYG